jgi:hypothetical protein
VTGLAASTASVSYDQGTYCANDPKTVTFSVSASDSDGLAGVTLYYRPPGSARFLTKPMAPSGGRYVATLNTTTDGLTTAGELRYYVVAKDRNASAKSTRQPASGSLAMTVKVCKNTGPTITGLGANPVTIYWVPPLGTANCSATASNVTAAVKDVDGLKSVRMYFRFNGGVWQSKAMDSKVLPGKWYANLDTVGDKFPRPSGSIDYYVRAVDKTDLASKSATKRITVKYCDTEAFFSQPSAPSSFWVPSASSGQFEKIYGSISVSDRNVTSAQLLKVTIFWQLKNSAGKVVLSGKTSSSWDGPFYWGVATSEQWRTALGGSHMYGTFVWWAVSTDPYGGTTDSRQQLKINPTNVYAL